CSRRGVTVTSGVIQLGCAACVAETMLSQDSTAGGGLKVRGPFDGDARAGRDIDGSALWARAPNGARAIAVPAAAQPPNCQWISVISRVVFHGPRLSQCNRTPNNDMLK